MAMFTEMFDAVLWLITSTIILIVVTLSIGPIIDFLAAWLPTMPAGRIPISPVQMVFGTFYIFILLLEGAVFVNLFLTAIRRTDYDTGESDF
jgi:hypothetical protein